MFTLGVEPYVEFNSKPEIIDFIKSGNRLGIPDYCDNDFYYIMMHCWEFDCSERPTFSELKVLISEIINSDAVSSNNMSK